ncbi:methyl-accepting chemotaxis protein [Effusibacillus lacus]|uniref:Methyl-accepting chemotaxis protein n=1 Tax=Effusibacillus lacus TaxID=1348429 RepID=A0A292YNV9_9BACL|nr:methyl-accepting chemotaxis protein [Effusibacillus lacus]TCS76524.1 methyl-accepting chemotaxis protein [Effusibacillus lacus]GAX90453.1 methyl-accepting chemotaxis protein [Effusibacillus lacus]
MIKKFKDLRLTVKITSLAVALVLTSVIAIVVAGYNVNFKQVMEAAGEELYGCASITSGLFTPVDIEDMLAGKQPTPSVQSKIDWIIDHKPIFMNAAIMTLDGKLLAPDKNLIKEGFKSGDKFHIDQEAVNMMKTMKHPTYSGIYTFGQHERQTGYAPIYKDHDPSKEIIAMMAIDFDSDIIYSRTWDSLRLIIVISVIFPIFTGFTIYLVVRRMLKPIQSVGEYAKRVAEGDLTIGELTVANRDEVGLLTEDFNKMAGSLKNIIQLVALNAHQVAASSEQLTASAEHTSRATGQITQAIQQIAAGTDQQLTRVHRTNDAVGEISSGIQQIAEGVQTVAHSSLKASETAEDGNRAMRHMMEQMSQINQKVQRTSVIIETLNEKSAEIGQMVTLITDIARQTNLLALNAAIEAARAGEQGKGFSVVADEVRKLAEQSGTAAEQIRQNIQVVQSEIENAVTSMHDGTLAAQEGLSIVAQTGESFRHIVAAVEEVSSQVQDINQNVKRIHDGTQSLVESIEEISDLSQQFAGNAQNVAAAAEEQNTTVEEIASSSAMLTRMAAELQEAVNRFRL